MINFMKRLKSHDDKVEKEPILEVANDTNEIDNMEELIAVIAAAAASMGLNLPDINIQSIRRVPQNTTPWADMGRTEQLFSRF